MNFLSKQIAKSCNDKRLYKHIILKNNLECLLISDKETDKSAASLSVGVGKLEDPREYEGLAHFLEHMLFLGTETLMLALTSSIYPATQGHQMLTHQAWRLTIISLVLTVAFMEL